MNSYGTTLSANTIRQRLGVLRTFFERIIEWDYDDAPPRVPVYASDLPKADEPLPRFLDDATAARLLRAAANDKDPFRRLVVELLARTGLRVGELCTLEANAVVRQHDGWWLRVPVGKLHNDRLVPLHPQIVELLADWAAREPANDLGLLLHRQGRPINRHVVTRILNRVAKAAGVGHVSPHQLRHTLATQAINRGMRLEAIVDLLGHRTLRMTMRYARIPNQTVADEYQAVSDQVDALYAKPRPLPNDKKNALQRRIREEQRLLRSTRRARLQLRIHLRKLRPLPNRTRVRPRPPPPTRPRRRPRPDRPTRPLRPDPHRHPTPTRLTHSLPVVGAAQQPSDHRHIPVLLDRITGISAVMRDLVRSVR
jgi:integrase